MVIKSSDVIRLGKSPDVVHRGKMSKNEMRIAGECLKEAFWSRAMPSATVAGASIYWAVRAGKLKSVGKSRFRTWSAVAGFSSITLLVVEFYLYGKNFPDKFLIQAPECFLSKQIRKTRNIKKLRFVDSLFPFFDERKMTDKEKQILVDCNSTAFYQFSLPAMVVASATSFFGVARSPWFQSRSRMAQLAPEALACLLGYYMGQWIYLLRRECPDSFVKHAPEGSIAKILQQHRDAPQDYELSIDKILQHKILQHKILHAPQDYDLSIAKILQQHRDAPQDHDLSIPKILQQHRDAPQDYDLSIAKILHAPQDHDLSIPKILQQHRDAPQDYDLSIAKILQGHRDAPQDYELFEGSQTVALVENEKDEYVNPASAQQYLNRDVNGTQPSPIQQNTSASITK